MGPLCSLAALEEATVDLDGQLPLVRPLPHVAGLADEFLKLLQDDYAGTEEGEEAAELRGEHSLTERFSEWSLGWPRGAGARCTRPLSPLCRLPPSLPGRLLRPRLQLDL